MKEFTEFIKEQDLRNYMQNQGVWPRKTLQTPLNDADPIPTESTEMLREINTSTTDALNKSPKKYNMGLENLKYEMIQEKRTTSGLQVEMESHGKAIAKNEMHVKVMLKKLMEGMEPVLRQKNIKMVVYYNRMEIIEESKEEYVEEPTGLIRNFRFAAVCSAIRINGNN